MGRGKKMKELTYKFQNPYNSCEAVYECKATSRLYALIPYTPYSSQLCTCTHFRGYYEADGPVKAGLTYCIDGKQVTTAGNGEIIDAEKKEEYENKIIKFYRIKPEFQDLPNYGNFTNDQLLTVLLDWIPETHVEILELKRKDVVQFFGNWYIVNSNKKH